MNRPTISVIIPVYNGERGLEKCINSVLRQTYKEIEVIVVDDGSTDKSADICALMAGKDERVKVLTTVNKGVSSSRNKGLSAAVGKYVTFVDADDYLDEDAYEKCMEILTGNPETDILKFEFYSENREKTSVKSLPCGGMVRKADYKEKIYPYLSRGDVFRTVWNAVFKRDVICQIKFDESLLVMEDLLFISDSLQASKCIYLCDDPLYHHVRYDNTLSNMTGLKENKKKIMDIEYVHEKVEKDLEKCGYYEFRESSIDYVRGSIKNKLCIIAGAYSYNVYKKAVKDWMNIGGVYLSKCLYGYDKSFPLYIFFRVKKFAKELLGR